MPSFNQAVFIEDSISSVLGQSYTRLELIVMDGGSDDGTVQVLEQLARKDHRMRWVSEPDMGPAHALNKAIAMARGSVLGWLNSDDLYAEGAVDAAVAALTSKDNPLMVYGRAIHIDSAGNYLDDYRTLKPEVGMAALDNGCFICQPSVFLKKVAAHLLGPLDQNLKASFDFDWWLRAFSLFEDRIGFIDRLQASSRLHDNCITRTARSLVAAEGLQLIKKHMGRLDTRWLISYKNEMLSTGQFQSAMEVWLDWVRRYGHLFTESDLKLIEKSLHIDGAGSK